MVAAGSSGAVRRLDLVHASEYDEALAQQELESLPSDLAEIQDGVSAQLCSVQTTFE